MSQDASHQTTETRIAAIRELVDEAQAYQFDIEPFIARHAPDAIIVNFGGRRVDSRDALQRAMEQALTSPLATVVTTTEIHDIRFLRPDVAVVSCTKHVSDGRARTKPRVTGSHRRAASPTSSCTMTDGGASRSPRPHPWPARKAGVAFVVVGR